MEGGRAGGVEVTAGVVVDTDVFSFDALRPGNVVTGPGIAEMEFSTIVVPPKQQLRIEEHGLGILEDDDLKGTEGSR